MSHPPTAQGGMCLRGWEGGQIRRKQKMEGGKVRLGAKIRDHAIQSRKNIKRFYKEGEQIESEN